MPASPAVADHVPAPVNGGFGAAHDTNDRNVEQMSMAGHGRAGELMPAPISRRSPKTALFSTAAM